MYDHNHERVQRIEGEKVRISKHGDEYDSRRDTDAQKLTCEIAEMMIAYFRQEGRHYLPGFPQIEARRNEDGDYFVELHIGAATSWRTERFTAYEVDDILAGTPHHSVSDRITGLIMTLEHDCFRGATRAERVRWEHEYDNVERNYDDEPGVRNVG